MKRTLTVILIIISFGLNAQTALDSMLFNKINEYRVSNGVEVAKWDSNVFKAANHHSTYLILLNKDSVKTIMTHSEEEDVSDFKEISGVESRLSQYANINNKLYGENITGAIKNIKTPNESFVELIFNKWKSSKKHNKIMLSPDLTQGACSIVFIEKKFYVKYKGKVIGTPMKKCFATLDLYN